MKLIWTLRILAAILLVGLLSASLGLAAKTTPKPVLPRLLELGSDKCTPCKMMKPILAELTREYKGKLKVDFIDVRKVPSAIQKYKVQRIPTQVFYDRKGKEFFRHEGFMPKDDILAKFKEQGIILRRGG